MVFISVRKLTSIVVIIIFIDGLLKPNAPGSLLQPSRTSLFPDTWATVPLSLGLIIGGYTFQKNRDGQLTPYSTLGRPWGLSQHIPGHETSAQVWGKSLVNIYLHGRTN